MPPLLRRLDAWQFGRLSLRYLRLLNFYETKTAPVSGRESVILALIALAFYGSPAWSPASFLTAIACRLSSR
jgi:hypothetical protein